MRAELERRLAVQVEPLERAVLDGVHEFESEPDRVRVELGIVPVFTDERPLIGLAGLLDWRSSGRLSAVVRSNFFTGTVAEQLLTPGERRWPFDRLVLIGVGARAEFDEARARGFGSRCAEIAAGLDAGSVLIALPTGAIEREIVEVAFGSLLDAIASREGGAQSQAGEESTCGERVERVERAERVEPVDAIEVEPPTPEPACGFGQPNGTDGLPGEPADAFADEPPEQPSGEHHPALESQPEKGSEPGSNAIEREREPEGPESRWWVVADESVVARLRRVRSGPPRAARGGPSLYT